MKKEREYEQEAFLNWVSTSYEAMDNLGITLGICKCSYFNGESGETMCFLVPCTSVFYFE